MIFIVFAGYSGGIPARYIILSRNCGVSVTLFESYQIIEGFSVVQVIRDLFQYDDIFNYHDLRLALSFSREMNSALPVSIFRFLSSRMP